MTNITAISRLLSAFGQHAPQSDERHPALSEIGGWYVVCSLKNIQKKCADYLVVSENCVNTHILSRVF